MAHTYSAQSYNSHRGPFLLLQVIVKVKVTGQGKGFGRGLQVREGIGLASSSVESSSRVASGSFALRRFISS